jgi:hypothetical protein
MIGGFLVVEAGQQQKYRFWNILAYCHHEKVLDPFFNIFPFPPVHTRANGKRGGSSQPPATHESRGHQCEMPHLRKTTTPTKRMSCLTVGLLEARAGTLTTELLGLASSAVGNEECAVVGDKSLLQLVLGVLIDELLVVGDL